MKPSTKYKHRREHVKHAASQASKLTFTDQLGHELNLYALLFQARTDVFDDKQRSEHDFFEYVANSYKYFLAGDDYQSQAVDDAIAQEAEERAEEVRQRNQQLQQVSCATLSLSLCQRWPPCEVAWSLADTMLITGR